VSQQSISKEAASTLRIGSLCTGYGGLDLAVEAYFNAETVWCAEFDKYASQVIEQRFDIPNYGNIKEIDWATLPEIDILTAGYPCQPFSTAGERKGLNDERHIFPYIAKAISILRPKLVILENVRGHLSLGLKEVLAELATIGYDARWQTVRAADVGAPHRRERLFICAYPNGERCTLGYEQSDEIEYQRKSQFEFSSVGKATGNTDNCCIGQVGEICGKCSSESSGIGRTIGNTDNGFEPHIGSMPKLGRRFTSRCDMYLQEVPNPLDQDGKLNPIFVEYMMGLPKGWVTDTGLSRAQQLKMLGNGVVPQQAKLALELLCDEINISHNETLYQPMLGDA
jgi:DNA (cytosine-5)-methyltransferase 1